MAKKKKIYPDDDGHTICNMNVEGMPWYESEQVKKNRQSLKEDAPTKKEVRAMIKARFLATLPYLLFDRVRNRRLPDVSLAALKKEFFGTLFVFFGL